MSSGRLFLIDGSALVYRSYYAFARNPLITSKGEDISVCFGFASTILKIINKENLSHLAVMFDVREPSFRHDMYDQYKANRKAMPDELAQQLPRLDQLLETMKIPVFRKPGYEADDLIGTLARKASADSWEVVIFSGDKDLFQLVDDKTTILNLRKTSEAGEWFDREAVKKKMGVPPDKIVDLLALMGDSSDNVPGVAGVGPKTAVGLLEEFGSFEAIFENVEKIPRKKLRENLAAHHEGAKLSLSLVILDTEVEFEYDYDSMVVPKLDSSELRKLFLEMEFRSLLKQLPHSEEEIPKIKQDYQTITTEAQLENLVTRINKLGKFAFDTETTSLNPLTCDLVGISIAVAAGEAFYIPIAHSEGGNLGFEVCRRLLDPLFQNKNIKKIAQNFKFDYHVLTCAGYQISVFDYDTMLASYVLDPSGQHGLDALALKHFDYSMQPISNLIGSGRKQISFADVPIDKASFYSAEDADITFRLQEKLEPMVAEIGADKLLHEIELPLCRVLAVMEANGVKINVDFLQKLSNEMAKQLDEITHDIYTLAGQEFNINSPSQLAEILFNRLKLKPLRKTAKGTGYSTDVNVLTELARYHDLPKRVLDYRHFQKLKSTYVDALPTMVNPETGRVHTSYNQAVAATGRLSSTDPNLQNIPIRTEEGSQIRKAFVPADSDHRIIAADYSQIELRILAHFSGDETLQQSFREGEDIHSRTASEVYGVDIDRVTSDMRRMAKVANFAVIYGVSAYGLSQQSDMTVAESREFIDIYYARYPRIKEFMESVLVEARKNGFVTTLFGRRRYLPEINSKNANQRHFAERTAVNTVIQGTAADMIKIAMIGIDKQIEKMKSKMIMQVHDELVFDAHKSELDKMRSIVQNGMENCVDLDVPLTVDIGIGDNWLECK